MTVNRLYSGSPSPKGPSTDRTSADRARTRPTAPVAPASSGGGSSDSLELSEAARARQAEAAAHKAEVETARKALHEQPGLSEERTAQIKQRLAEGYYDRPDVVAATADKLAGAFSGAEPAE